MKIDKDSNRYTVLFSVAMVIVVGIGLSTLSVVLKPMIERNKEIEKKQNILFVMEVKSGSDGNLPVGREEVDELYERFIGDRQYMIKGDSVMRTQEAFGVDLMKEMRIARANPGYEPRLPFFVGERDGETFYIFPVQGKGLWGNIWGHVSLSQSLDRLGGVVFDHEKETAGLGANMTEPFFRDDFIGEHFLDGEGTYQGITVKKGNGDPMNTNKEDGLIDAMAGATITSSGISTMLHTGIRMYLPYLRSM
ncbi:FMN-binding protein [Muricauda sp. NFXS6]|uniref:FMN-binding protein n=1 Tax=Allomuricauda sp. NFXS6 TaxID=2819094 RepID=UPI0032DF3131